MSQLSTEVVPRDVRRHFLAHFLLSDASSDSAHGHCNGGVGRRDKPRGDAAQPLGNDIDGRRLAHGGEPQVPLHHPTRSVVDDGHVSEANVATAPADDVLASAASLHRDDGDAENAGGLGVSIKRVQGWTHGVVGGAAVEKAGAARYATPPRSRSSPPTTGRNRGLPPTVSFPAPLGSGIEVVVDCAVTEMNARRLARKQRVAAVSELPERHTGSTNSHKSLSSGTSGSATSKSSACPSSGSSGSSATPSSSSTSGASSASSSAANRSGSESMFPREPYGLTHSSDGWGSRVANNSSKDASPFSSSSSRSETESVSLSQRTYNTAASAGRHPDVKKVVGNEMVAKEARPPKNAKSIVAAWVVPVNGPLHGVPYLIRQQTRTLETDGVVILRVSRDVRPSECALPADGKVSVRR